MAANEKLFECYIHEVLHLKGIGSGSIEDRINDQNRVTLITAAVLTAFVNIFWMIFDAADNEVIGMWTSIGLISSIPLIVISIIFLAVLLKKNDRNLTLITFIFYLCLIASVTLTGINKNMQIVKSGAVSRYLGIPLSAFLLLFPVVAPMAGMKESLILCAAYILSLFIPLICPGKEAYQLPSRIILYLCYLSGYFAIRSIHIHLAEATEENSSLNRKLLSISYHDALTEVFNRRAFDEYADELLKDDKTDSVSMIMMDIDNFKSYNDHYFHSEGDKALYSIAQTIQCAVEPTDLYLFRYGGEEFAILIPNCAEANLLETGKTVRDAVHKAALPREDIPDRKYLTVSVGCARVSRPDSDLSGLFREADSQLYIGKQSGKDCVVLNGTVYR